MLRRRFFHSDTLLVIAVAFPVAALIYNNSRMSDVKDAMRAEIGQLRAEMNLAFERLSNKLAENHRETLSKIAEHERAHH